MLKLRRGTVVSADPLEVLVGGERRPAWADEPTVGHVREGDEVVVNVEALDLELGSGGFDVVHVNLTRGLDAPGAEGMHVMKLNYTSLQHAVEPVEARYEDAPEPWNGPSRPIPALVFFLHGQLAPAAWAAARAAPGLRIGYVQTPGGALPGSLSRDVASLRECGLLCGHLTAAAAHGGEREAISVPGALHAAADKLGWDAVVAGPGPGILGSATALGHGGMSVLDTAHAALALGLPTLIAPRLSSGDPRRRHRGLSHHAEAVLRMLLAPVRVPVPELDEAEWPVGPAGEDGESVLDRLRKACGKRHDIWVREAALDEYASSGLPSRIMGRDLVQDRLFYAAALAAGDALAVEASEDVGA
ncbi:MAG: hypothetical protein K0S15_1366 [Solirubrobacterales bacterium]|jgi:hypothetical protein|nr:hypothetical protein [Solirubrobacterales bacterium]